MGSIMRASYKSLKRRRRMGRKGSLIFVLVVMTFTLLITRWYYQVPGGADFLDVVQAIYTTTAIAIATLGVLIALKK